MSWFDEQLRNRARNDSDAFSDSFARMARVVMGRKAAPPGANDRRRSQDAIGEILKYYHVREAQLPGGVTGLDDQLEYLLRPSGVMRRPVRLEGKWYAEAIGPLLGRTKAGAPVALLPHGWKGYTFFDWERGVRVRVDRRTAAGLDASAIQFYRPLPAGKLGVADLLRFIAGTLSAGDVALAALAALAVTLVGLCLPMVNRVIFAQVIPAGDPGLLLPVAVLLLGVTVSAALLQIPRSLTLERIQVKMDATVQAASMMRLLALPTDFFKQYSAGELASRVQNIQSLCGMFGSAIFSTGFTALFSLVYVGQIARYAAPLAVPALAIIALTAAASVAAALVGIGVTRRMMQCKAKESGLVFSLFSGVQKIKLSGAERRAFAKWASQYCKTAALQYDPPLLLKLAPVISMAISLLGGIALYWAAASSGIALADYMAFNASYGMVSGAFLSLASIVSTVASIRPTLDMARPLLNAEPEVAAGKQVVTRLSGGIELNNVSFRYGTPGGEASPLILDNLSLKIRPGQYIAIVGPTGCGKSTLMRLLLGFERPQKGAVYYDGKDLSSMDLRSLRRHIGVVMQNGKLFQGDIFSNIVISAPWLTLGDAWEAAERAGIAEDIRSMPMGMHTIISEGAGGVSGGQRQRLMIARAIAPKPKVLMFDEATSALDNLTQKTVSQSLDSLKCTRIVIAHRLSTIRQCDRILVLDKGRIIEDGSYDELIAQGGFFSGLVARQRLDDEAFVGKTTLF